MATRKATKTAKTSAGKTSVKQPTASGSRSKVAVKPKIRINRVSAKLAAIRPRGEAVVDLHRVSAKPAKGYGDDVYDEVLANGEAGYQDDLTDEPVESLGELLPDEERLAYEEPAAAKTVSRRAAQAAKWQATDQGQRLYKKIALLFGIVVIIVAAAAAYFLLVKVKISLTLKDEAVARAEQLSIYDQSVNPRPEGSFSGLVERLNIEQSKSFTASGSEVIGEEVSGQMILYNKYIKNQPLVATTRLLAADGKLFRLKNSVNIPAGGQLTVDVYADQPHPDLVVGNERFSIPGLWQGLQDKIYGESQSGQIVYKKRVKGIISQADIDQAVAAMKEALITQAKTDTANSYGNLKTQLYQLDESSVTTEVDAKPGEEKEAMNVKIKGAVLVVAFNGDDTAKWLTDKAKADLTAGKVLAPLVDGSITYKINQFDFDKKMAKVESDLSAQATVTDVNQLIDKHKLTNLSRARLEAYLKSIPEVASFSVDFYPPFIQQGPSLVDRIEVTVIK